MIKHRKIASRLDPSCEGFADDPFFIVPRPPSLQLPLSDEAMHDGSASIDLRLGTWFLAMRPTTTSLLEAGEPSELSRRLRCATRELDLSPMVYEELKRRLLSEETGAADFADRLRRAIEGIDLNSEIHNSLKSLLVPKTGDGRLARSYHVCFGEDFILHPRSFVLGVTLEWLRFPSDLGGYVTGRSSWGRRGLVIATATGVHPGFTGCLTLELANLGDIPISIRPGMTVGQLFVHAVDSETGDRSVDQSGFACKRAPKLGYPQSDEIARKLAHNAL